MASKPNEVSVSLRLVLDELRKDIKTAAKDIKAGLTQDIGQSKSKTEGAAKAVDEYQKKVKTAAQSVRELKKATDDAYQSQRRLSGAAADSFSKKTQSQFQQAVNNFGKGSTATSAFAETQRLTQRRLQLEELRGHRAAGLRGYNIQDFFGNRGAFAPKYRGPTPPVIPPPIIPSAAAAGGAGAGGGGINWRAAAGAAGFSRAAMAARLGPIGVAVAAVLAVLAAMKMAAQEMSRAIERARELYAKQLQSGGLPGGFIAKRAALADVIGVGEREVFQYGKAVEYLNERLAWSAHINAETTPALTSVSWAFKVLNEDLKAAWARAANDLAPALRSLAEGLSVLVKLFSDMRQVLVDIVKNIPGLTTGLRMIAGFAAFVGALSGGSSVAEAIAAAKKGAATVWSGSNAPTPETSYKRLATSAWEKMGLVIGSGHGTNWSEQTAKNTGKLVYIMSNFVNPREHGRKDLQPRFAAPAMP